MLIPQFPGQTHIFFWREILELQKMGVNVTLFSTRPPPAGLISHRWSQDAMVRTNYLVDTNPVNAAMALVRFPWAALRQDLRHEPREFLKDILLSLPAARRLAKACKAAGITHVHAHSARRAATIAALAKVIWGLDYSVTLHGPMSDYGPGQGFKWRHARFGTVITRKLMRELGEALGDDLPKHLYLQPMGVDTDELTRTTPYEAPVEGGPLRLFSCGRLNIVKGHQDVMEAVKLLRDRGIDAKLEIAGQDDDGGAGYYGVLAAKIKELGLEAHVTLLGAIDAEAVQEKLLAAHIFVLASWHEPLGVAYMEAMSCAVPTVGTDAGGVPELITHDENGVLVPPKDPEALADMLASLAATPERLMALSVAGRKTIVEGFSSRKGAQTLVQGLAETD
ncbi:exopolysaccharide biosynthesis GT4 family glycosyltransferase EpsE [Lentibacter sp. XHP0401]|uniref:exopolysaccharide biosynthesis GT4 family glycosyltransferase EpsE n=1 Tax=Lentibacter sp. XHP0401 TaxID=2984334 RepID=UPI0021E8D0B9|nr:exopolysaccharide biosynthesis GT4 family glycosyltransferase EpsE [Lentibacter sp. XHP0401]MCV2893394.1 glycosyltransferase [Lentibacter sp. XHP0401]